MRFRCEQCNAQYMIADEKVGQKGVRVRCKKCGTIITVRPGEPDADDSSAERDQTAVNQDPSAEEPAGFEAEAPTDEAGPDRTTVDSDPAGEELQADDGQGELNIGEEDVGSAFDNLLGENGQDEEAEQDFDQDQPDEFDRQSTRVFSYEEMQKVQEEKEQAAQEREQFADLYSSAKADAEQQERGDQAALAPADDADRDRVEWYAAVDEQQVGPMSINDIADRWQRGEFDPETLVWKTGFEDWLVIQEVPVLQFLLGEAEEPPPDEAPAAAAPEEEPAEEAPGGWAGSFGEEAGDQADDDDEDEALGRVFDEAAGEEQAPAEEEPGEEAEAGDEYSGFDDDEADEGYQDEDEDLYVDDAPDSASAEAFAADVDWKPSAIASLNTLAEEELASLKPPPEPEVEEEMPFGEDIGLPGEEDGDEGVEMEDGDSSIIGQIAAEEEAAARLAEEERLAEERRNEETRRKEEEEALAAQEAARRELEEEQREKAAPPPEQVIPTRTGLPKWVWGAIGACVVVIIALSVVIAYKFGAESSGPEPSTSVAAEDNGMQPMQPPDDQPVNNASTAPSTGPGGAAKADTKTATAPAPGAETAKEQADSGDAPAKADTASGKTKPEKKPDPKVAARPAVHSRPKTPPARRRKQRRRKKPAEEKKVVKKEEPPPPPSPPPEEKKPKRRKPKGGILDFEDEKAFADVTGTKTVAPDPKPEPVKKKLPPLSNADVLSVMRKHLAEFKACNRKQKEIDPSVRGRMVVNFVINPNGRVAKVTVSTKQFKSTFVSKCISRTIQQLHFPAFGGAPKKVPFPFTVK